MVGVDALRVLRGLALGEALALRVAISGDPGDWGGVRLDGVLAYGSVTESAVILARSLAAGCGFNPGLFASMLAEQADLENPLRLYSAATAEVLTRIRRGASWEEARSSVTALEPPVEAVARAAPVPLFYSSRRLAADMSAAQALVTSLDPVVASAARLYGATLHHVLQGLPVAEAALEAALEEPLGPARIAVLEALEALEHRGEPPRGRGPVPAALASAVYAAGRAEEGLEPLEALRLAARLSPEPRSSSAMAASLLAAAGLLEPGLPLEAGEMLEEAAAVLEEARGRCIFTD